MNDTFSFKIYLWFFIMITSSFSIKSQENFVKELFINETDTLPYNILKPLEYFNSLQDNPERIVVERLYPLVLFLHGAGERGNDNEKQIVHIKELFLDSTNRIEFQAFVIAPQCPQNKQWVETDWTALKHTMTAEPSWAVKNVMLLIDELIAQYPIDQLRIYITGLSMGGYGAWDIISRYPDKFAAAIPVCGGGDENSAAPIKNMPIWAFHGGNDKVVPVIRSRNMIKAIEKEGGSPRYTEYKGVGHNSWVKAYKEKDFLKWLFEKYLQR